jgi:glycolate oxidase
MSEAATKKHRRPALDDLAALAADLPEGSVHVNEPYRERYARDESTRLHALPSAVVVVQEADDVSRVMQWAAMGSFPIVTRGLGTGVAGGCVALDGELVLSLEKLDHILEIDEANFTVTCEPGVITQTLQQEVERRGLFYPPDPASADVCSIGGNVAVGAGGARAVKYGTTRDYLLGMQLVLADGSVLELGGKNVKDATGYHLMELMVGSEGTLGIITRITLRLLPLPARRVSLLLPFADIDSAARAVTEILRARIIPAVAEFMDEVAIEAAAKHLGRSLPADGDAGAYVFIQLDGEDATVLEQQMLRVSELAEAQGALQVLAAEDEGQQQRLWESRRVLGDAMKAMGRELGKADVVVPRAQLPQLVREVKELSRKVGIPITCFGHAGDGNVHVNVLRGALDDATWQTVLEQAMTGIMDTVLRLGGRPSGEHGIGILKKPFMADFLGENTLDVMRRVKAAFDPQLLLNPGKVL